MLGEPVELHSQMILEPVELHSHVKLVLELEELHSFLLLELNDVLVEEVEVEVEEDVEPRSPR